MKRLYLVLAVLAAFYLDSIFFARINLNGIRPDAVMALVAAVGILVGSRKGAVMGLVCGLAVDVLYGKLVGPSAIGYMVCGALGGAFHQKFYADNLVFPAAVAFAGALFKENVMAAASALCGARFAYFGVLVSYIIPCALMTTVLCLPLHILMKRVFTAQVRTERRPLRGKPESGAGGPV